MKVVVTALTLAALAFCAAAQADVGVMSTSRHAGAPGDTVKVTLGCGFCFPPCEGPKGERHPAGFDHGPCMLGTHGTPPPESFGLSLVPLTKAPRPHPCGPNALCPPMTMGPPGTAPFRYLGLATPPPGGNNPEHGAVPRYILEFKIPHLAPGTYTYAIWCDACGRGKTGSVILNPRSHPWRLKVKAN